MTKVNSLVSGFWHYCATQGYPPTLGVVFLLLLSGLPFLARSVRRSAALLVTIAWCAHVLFAVTFLGMVIWPAFLPIGIVASREVWHKLYMYRVAYSAILAAVGICSYFLAVFTCTRYTPNQRPLHRKIACWAGVGFLLVGTAVWGWRLVVVSRALQ